MITPTAYTIGRSTSAAAVDDDLAQIGTRSPCRARELAIDVLHHHHRAVDEDAEVDRADGEQVRRNVPEVEADEREQQRRAESSIATISPDANVVEEEDQHDDDEQDAAQQVVRARCAS